MTSTAWIVVSRLRYTRARPGYSLRNKKTGPEFSPQVGFYTPLIMKLSVQVVNFII
jgi:hypothetical protein